MVSQFIDANGKIIEERKDKMQPGSVYGTLLKQGDHRWEKVKEVKYFGDGVLVRHVKFSYGGPVDVAEVYSPPRVTVEASKYNLAAGEAFDLTCGWNFNKPADRARVEAYVLEREPLSLIGSPLCTMFSSLQNLSAWSDAKQEKLEEGKRHLRFCMKLYRMQVASGRMFLHEHPFTATSWNMPEVKAVAQLAGVQSVIADQGMYGLKVRGQKQGEVLPAKKSSRFLTNSWQIASRLTKEV